MITVTNNNIILYTAFFGQILFQKGDENSDPEKLVIHNVTHEDEAWYTCLAGNKLGYTSSSAYLKVVDSE